jgi:adenylate cyclase
MRFPLRAKFFVFATLIATAPLALVGENLVRIARDELKSAANEELTNVAAGLAEDVDTTVQGRWLTPLLVIRNGIDSDALGVEQKISLLTLGLSQIPNVAALQLSIEGSDLPILVTDQDFSKRLADAGLDPVDTLRTTTETIDAIRRDGPCRSAPSSPAAP